VFVVIWFSVAHILKSKVLVFIKNSESDNVKISYSKIQVSGFPNLWKIQVLDPIITLVDHKNSKELSSKELICIFDLSFKKARLNFGHEIKHKQDFVDQTKIHIINSSQEIEFLIKFNQALFSISNQDNLYDSVKFLKINNDLLSVNHQNQKIFDLSNLFFIANKSLVAENENVRITFHAFYNKTLLHANDLEDNLLEKPEFSNKPNNLYSFLNFDKVNLNIDTTINFIHSKNNVNQRIIKDFDINHMNLIFEDSKINVTGLIEFLKNSNPEGKLFVMINNYNKAIDKLLANNPFISKSKLKRTILQMADLSVDELNQIDLENINDIKFDIEFSNYGIKLGKIKLIP